MKNVSVMTRVVKEIGRSRFLIAASLVFSVASVILSLYIPVLAGKAIDCISAKGAVDFAGVKSALFYILICAAAGGLLQWLMSVINNRIAYNTVKYIRAKAFNTYKDCPYRI